MKKIEKSCKKIVKATNKVAKKNPVAAVVVGGTTGILAVTGVGLIVEKIAGKVACKARAKKTSKKKDEE